MWGCVGHQKKPMKGAPRPTLPWPARCVCTASPIHPGSFFFYAKRNAMQHSQQSPTVTVSPTWPITLFGYCTIQYLLDMTCCYSLVLSAAPIFHCSYAWEQCDKFSLWIFNLQGIVDAYCKVANSRLETDLHNNIRIYYTAHGMNTFAPGKPW